MDATPQPPGGGNGGGGGGGEGGASGPRPFAVGYRAHTGDLMVYGGGVMTLIGVLGAVVNGTPAFLLASVVGTLSALYFHPTLDLRTPQLGADTSGIFVARIGVIPWSSIADIHVERRAVRTMHLATLIIRTGGPLNEAVVAPDPVPLMMRLTARNANVSGNTIKVSLHPLNATPEVIEGRLRALAASSTG